MWISAAFVVFSASGCVVGCLCSVGGGCGFGHWVGYGDVNVSGCVVVGCDDVHDGTFLELWWAAGVGVKFRDMDCELCVLAVLLQPFGECACDVVVALDTVWASTASGSVLCVVVKCVLALCGGGGVLAIRVALVVRLSEAEFDGCYEVLVWQSVRGGGVWVDPSPIAWTSCIGKYGFTCVGCRLC